MLKKLTGVSFSILTPQLSCKCSISRYYGYRNVDGLTDPRLDTFATRKEIFANKDILDIGCNIGHVSYTVARDFGVKSLLGIDIDNSLIKVARKNVRYYSCTTSPAVMDLMKKCDLSAESAVGVNTALKFPDNVSFLHVRMNNRVILVFDHQFDNVITGFVFQSNYVPYDDAQLVNEEPKYDVILYLSVSKWIHLNWGDDGLKRTFKKIFIQLRSGGVFVLEAQPFESYKKKKLSVSIT